MNNIYYPSYKRWEKVRAYEYFGCGTIVVPESQASQYRERYGKAVRAIPDSQDGSIPRKRNAVLELIAEEQPDGYGFMVDDDISHIKRKKEGNELSGDEALELLEKLYIMAKDMGARFGGFDYSEDNLKLKDMAPFSLTKPVFHLVLINVLDGVTYDERIRVGSDTEFWIAKQAVNRRMIKDNQYVVVTHGVDGGENSVIGYDRVEQRRYAKLVNNKWGINAMDWNGKSFRFKLPIKGT